MIEDIQDIDVAPADNELADDETGQLYEHFRFVADPGMSPLRVDKFMAEKLPHRATAYRPLPTQDSCT